MIPEWLSFRNKIIPSLYISVYLFMWCRNNISFLYKSFLNEFIPVFNPNEILILVSCKLKLCSGWKITNLVVWGVWHMSIWSGVKPHKWECLRQSHSFLSCEYRRNFVLDQNTFRNECPIVIAVSYKQPLCEEPFLFPIAVYIAKVARLEKQAGIYKYIYNYNLHACRVLPISSSPKNNNT